MKKKEADFSVLVVVTAGLGNAVDVSRAHLLHKEESKVGTINTWIFIEGCLSEAAFVQGLMTATEAKVKALHDQKVCDPLTATYATGTSTDSTMIGATQTGKNIPYAGTATLLGKTLGFLIYEATKQAIEANQRRTKGE